MVSSATQIIRAIENSHVELRTLCGIEFRLDECGKPIHRVGNSAVVFTVWHRGRWCSFKCYTFSRPRHKVIYGSKLLPAELYVAVDSHHGVWLDVLIEPWIDGQSLDEAIGTALATNDLERLACLSKNFDAMALELLRAEWAHGDLSLENIIVDHHNKPHLIDLDSAYLPQLRYEGCVELGTRAYQHPRRNSSTYDPSIDDYPIALISTALAALSLEPLLATQHQFIDGLLLDPEQMVAGQSEALEQIVDIFARQGKAVEHKIAQLLTHQSVALNTLAKLLAFKVEGVDSSVSSDSLTPFVQYGHWGFSHTTTGLEVIPPIFDEVFDFVESRAAVRIGSSWHYIDTSGNVVINCSQYQAVKSFRNGEGRVRCCDGRWTQVR